MGLIDDFRYFWTLWQWKRCAHHRQHIHIKIGNLPDFFRQLNEDGVKYVVLRWFERIPLTPDDERMFIKHGGDVDILADADDLLKVCRAVAAHPGKIRRRAAT